MKDSAKKTESETSNQIYFVQSGSWDLVPSSYFFQGQGQPLRRTTNWPDGGIVFSPGKRADAAMELENIWEITLTL